MQQDIDKDIWENPETKARTGPKPDFWYLHYTHNYCAIWTFQMYSWTECMNDTIVMIVVKLKSDY